MFYGRNYRCGIWNAPDKSFNLCCQSNSRKFSCCTVKKESFAKWRRDCEERKSANMFTPIVNWPVYLVACGILAALFYAVVLFRYYRGELFKSGKQPLSPPTTQASLFPQDQGMTDGSSINRQQVELTHSVHDLTDELRALLQQLAAQASGKEELLSATSRLLKKYPALNGSGFQQPLTNLIAAEAENHCNIRLAADELEELWN